MEQRIGPVVPPIHAAGTDPAYVPGLTLPSRPAGAPDTESEQVTDLPPREAAEQSAEQSADADATAPAEPVPGAQSAPASPDAGAEKDPDESEVAADRGEPDGGPVFEVSDRRATILADHYGITLRLDDEEAEFRWDEIGAVEIDTPRFGRRFAVTVYTGSRRWYEGDVEAPSRAALKTWTAELDAVLDVRFPDGEAAAEPAAPDAEAAPDEDPERG